MSPPYRPSAGVPAGAWSGVREVVVVSSGKVSEGHPRAGGCFGAGVPFWVMDGADDCNTPVPGTFRGAGRDIRAALGTTGPRPFFRGVSIIETGQIDHPRRRRKCSLSSPTASDVRPAVDARAGVLHDR